MRTIGTLALVTLVTFTLGGVSSAIADPIVLAIEGHDIYLGLGARDGVGAGSELELLHQVVARDPRTGATLHDRFALGTIVVEKSGASVSIAHADEALVKRVLVGDAVRLLSAKRTFADPWAEQVATSKGEVEPPVAPLVGPATPSVPTPVIDHADLALTTWKATVGQPIDQRIARWTELQRADPRSPYHAAIDAEITSLRRQAAQRVEAIARASATTAARPGRDPHLLDLIHALDVPVDDRDAELIVAPLERAVPGRAIELAFIARNLEAPASLFVRPAGESGFRRSELRRDGDAYVRGTIEASQVHVGALAYYVVVGDREVIGTAANPRTITVEPTVAEAPVELHRTHIDAHVDYVDFDGKFDKGYDQYAQAELDFTYRFLEPIYAFRIGFGTLTGTGGPKDVIDLDPMTCLDDAGTYRCRRVTFSYIYTELEFRLRKTVALLLRPQVGLLTTDTMNSGTDRCKTSSDIGGCAFETPFGLRARVRLGEEDSTNLVLGVGITRDVGTLLEVAYNWRPHPVVPVQLSVQVTDQPVVENFGVRIIADVGIRQLAWFYPSVRVSYQARDIDHTGFSGGLALNFDW